MSKIADYTRLSFETVKSVRAANKSFSHATLAPNERRGFRYPVVYSYGNLIMTPTSTWIGHKIPMKQGGFLSDSQQRSYFFNAQQFYAQVFPDDKNNAGQLIVTNLVYSGTEWARSLKELHEHISLDIYPRYVDGALKTIDREVFYEKECFLFTKLGNRTEATGARGVIRKGVNQILSKSGSDDFQPDYAEKMFWSEAGDSVTVRYNSSWLDAMPMSRRRVEALVRHLDTPGLPTPDVASFDEKEWEFGEWRTVLASYVEPVPLGRINKYQATCLKIDAPTGISHVAYLPMVHVPRRVRYNANWLHKASRFTFPVDINVYFEILPPDEAEKVVGSAIEKAEVQQSEDAEAGIRSDETVAIQNETARQVKTEITMARQSMVNWRAVLAVYADDVATLRDRVEEVITRYKDDHIDLQVPHRDQRELFYESLPGTGVIVEDWFHKSNTKYFAAAMPWLTTTIGDGEESPANYQGWTVNRDGSRDKPFFYDLQNVAEVIKTAPTEAVYAHPGYGKTVSRGCVPAHQNAMQGHTVFIWDPKGDFITLYTNRAGLRLDPDRVLLLDMNSPGLSVSLDAYAIAEVDPVEGIDDRFSSARDVLTKLAFRFVNSPTESVRYLSIITQVVMATMDEAQRRGVEPTMALSMQILEAWTQQDFRTWPEIPEEDHASTAQRAKLLFTEYNLVRTNKYGKFLFNDPTRSGTIKVAQGDMVIFAAKDMPVTEADDDPSEKTIVGDIISGLMVDYIRSLVYRLPADVPKNVYLDEYHVIKRSPRAGAFAGWLKRMGRSKNVTVTQLSQSANDDSDSTALSTVWCGFPGDHDEAEASCLRLGIEPTEDNKNVLMSLNAGEFIVRDVKRNIARVYVHIWDKELFRLFNTQASTVAREQRARERAARRAVETREGVAV